MSQKKIMFRIKGGKVRYEGVGMVGRTCETGSGRGLAGERAPVAQYLGHGYLGRPVEHDAERAALLVRDQQHDGALEVGVAQGRRRDQ